MTSPAATPGRTRDVVVVGAGLIGTAIAWRLASAGLDVALVTGERAHAASRVAAGMLAPVTETTFTEQGLLALNLASAAAYPGFAAEVEEASGASAGLSQHPTLSVGYDADDAARLGTFAAYLTRLQLPSERLTSRECRRLEPLLSPRVRAGLLVDGDWSIDNRRLLAALTTAAARAGVVEVPGFVHAVTSSQGRVTGAMLADGTALPASRVVLACGAWAAQIGGLPGLPVRPVKGQILRLDPGRSPQLGVTVRAFSAGAEVYLVPRPGGRELVVGATVEEQGFDGRATAGGVYELLRDARQVVPMTVEYALVETSVGWRPGTPDNAPILGACDLDGLILATGHYRNGVLLTPITAQAVADLVLTGQPPEVARPFSLARFDRPRVAVPETVG